MKDYCFLRKIFLLNHSVMHECCYIWLNSLSQYMHYFLLILFLLVGQHSWGQQVYKTDHGSVNFKSDAAMELIKASSQKLFGAIDSEKKTFSFVVKIVTFEGFNVGLQKEHFNENYMESDKFKTASFTGKIIEDVDFSKPGKYPVRAKGVFNVHGVEQERIIKCTLEVLPNAVVVQTEFTVLLDDHQIRVPRVVYEKVASEIIVVVSAELNKVIK